MEPHELELYSLKPLSGWLLRALIGLTFMYVGVLVCMRGFLYLVDGGSIFLSLLNITIGVGLYITSYKTI